jgi:NodT family efflux transporter outer membrane factor (OMF) lipoprotein
MHRIFRPCTVIPSHAFPPTGAKRALLLAAAACLAGCAPGRVNLAPRPAIASGTDGGDVYSIFNDKKQEGASWWLGFKSVQLDMLTTRALEKNFDVTAAGERLNQALAARRRAGGALWPDLRLTGSYDVDIDARGRSLREDGWEAGLETTWEVDLFKRLSSVRLARAADVQARIHLMEAVRLSLSVSVAETYFGIVEQRQLLVLLAKQKGTSTELLRIIERRYEQGLSSRLDVLQQQSQLAEINSQIPTAESVLQDLKNQLGVLLSGLPGADATGTVGEGAGFPTLPALERLGRPDELLNHRPDLRAAQADLVAADADTARALAERLPRLTFSAEALLIEGRGPEGHLVTLGADLLQPLLDWGQRRSEWVRTQAIYRERMANFSQAYLRAVWSVETIVQNEAKQKELLRLLQERKELLDATLGLATRRYTSGLTDYLPVLTAMQQLYALEQRLIREERRLTSLRIALHQALGGPVMPVAPQNAEAHAPKRS